LSDTQTFGFSTNVLELLVKVVAALNAAGFNGDEMRENLQKMHDKAAALNAQQEQLKRDLRDTSIELRKCMRELYNLASGYVDSAMTAVERSSPDAKIIRRLRSRIRRPNVEESPAVQPAPMKTQ